MYILKISSHESYIAEGYVIRFLCFRVLKEKRTLKVINISGIEV